MLDLEAYQNIEKGKNKSLNIPYTKRDLSWIDFNRRVLMLASDKNTPMNERANFIGITESNLDEFIAVRYPSSDEESPEDKVKLLKEIKKFISERDEVVKGYISQLHTKYKITLSIPKKLSKKELIQLEKDYYNNIFPLMSIEKISEYRIDNAYPFIGVTINDNGIIDTFVIPILKAMDRFYITNENNIVTIEDIITHFLPSLFINKEIIDYGVFRVIQDYSIMLEHDTSKSIINRMEDILHQRMNSRAVLMQYREGCGAYTKEIVSDNFGLSKKVLIKRHFIDYKIFSSFNVVKGGNYKKFTPKKLHSTYNNRSMFEILDKNDLLLHHPYDSYDTVINFIKEATGDPCVVTIKQTLYRVSSIDSPIVEALCNAARNGKKVIVMVEIKARFDERNNIDVYKKLTNAGCLVTLGDEYKKTHCKMCVVTRKTGKDIKVYSHVATGNYNENTSRIYTDISYLTSNRKIGQDLTEIFNILLGSSKPSSNMNKIFYSPVNLRQTLIKYIDNEIKIAKNGKRAEIIMKINSISDKAIINKLYLAADKGVKVTIIVRGICSIIPRKNLNVKSIVGRFLEHSRIYYFRNRKNHDYFISSADLLPRNLDKRIEIMIHLNNDTLDNNVSKILSLMKNDTTNSFIETRTGNWIKETTDKKKEFNAHKKFIEMG